MNTPTETLAESLRMICSSFSDAKYSEISKALLQSASRLLAQHETMMKQDERIAALEAELEAVRGYYTSALDSERMWRAKADRYWQELEQERQDRKQADLDTIRALGERNDARKELEETSKDYLCLAELLDGHDATECRANLVRMKADLQAERALADRLAEAMERWKELAGYNFTPSTADEALAALKDARRPKDPLDIPQR
jgi:chromosome segregation ATPase